ncbi:MAG: HlyD family efflux transporter periplasmic adaptor subunit [Opitutaceae bacterium]|nr:HlyD family efflux transporter periplasmic adaptor subunit [Cytophagales bacterium]
MFSSGKNAIKKEVEDQNLYSIRLLNNYQNNNVIIRWLSFLMLVLFLCLFLPWQQSTESYGKVTALNPQDRPQSVQTVIAGRIEKWMIMEGDYIKKGDTILVLSEVKEKFMDPDLLKRTDEQIKSKEISIESKKQKIQSLQKQLSAIKSGLILSLEKTENKLIQAKMKIESDSAELVSSKADLIISERQYDSQKGLYDKGFKSLTELEQRSLKLQQSKAKVTSALNKLASTRNEYINAEIELNSVRAEYTDKISKAESELNSTQADIYDTESSIGKMRVDYSGLQVRNGNYAVKAPQDGYILKASKEGIGETVKEGEEVLTIMPINNSMAVELYVKPMDMPLLYKGCPVRVQFDGWPALVFSGWPNSSVGTFGGLVRVVDKVATKDGKFRMLVVPDPREDPWPEKVRIGTGANGWAMLNNVLLCYELWRQFNGFPPDYTAYEHKKEIEDEKKIKKNKNSQKEIDG